MPLTNDDLEAYLRRLDRAFQRVDDATYLVSLGAGKPPVALRIAAPVLVAQVDVAPAPDVGSAVEGRLYRKLLELNASSLVYVAYGIDRGRIVVDAALELASLDINELEAVLADLDLAIAEQVPMLHDLVKKG